MSSSDFPTSMAREFTTTQDRESNDGWFKEKLYYLGMSCSVANVLNIGRNIDCAADIVFLNTKCNDIWSFKVFIIFKNIVP